MVGGTHTSFKRVHAEQGHVFVVAASHLIFRFLQPLQARITGRYVRCKRNHDIGETAYPSVVCAYCVHPRTHSLERNCLCQKLHGIGPSLRLSVWRDSLL